MAALSEALKKEIEEFKGRYPEARAAVMPSLHRIKQEHGRLTPEIMQEVADLLEIPPLYVEEVASFYPLFQQNEGARHVVHVCVTLSCHLCGCTEILQHLENRYGLKPGGVTPDGRLALHESQCLGSSRWFLTRLGRRPLSPTRPPPARFQEFGRGAGRVQVDPLVQQMVTDATDFLIGTTWTDIVQSATTRHSPSSGCQTAAESVFDKFESYGLEPYFQYHTGGYAPNVVGTLVGSVNSACFSI